MMACTEMRYGSGGYGEVLKGGISDIMRSGYNVPQEIGRELRNLDSGVDHMRLDQDFLRSSKDWSSSFNPHMLAREQQGAGQATERAALTVQAVRGELTADRRRKMMENQLRDGNHGVSQALRQTQNDLGPFTHQSIDRIKQYCDHIGVTDRYTGYRHNLNRGNRDPVRLGFSWLDGQSKNAYNANSNVGFKPASSYSMPRNCNNTAAYRPVESAPARHQTGGHNKSIQERCGINTTFPADTEYMERYVPQPSQKAQHFIINPTPNTSIHGRPLVKLGWQPKFTEYQTRYSWPDSNKIVKLPWLRQ